MSRARRYSASTASYARFLDALRYANAAAVELRVQHHHFTQLMMNQQNNPETLGQFAPNVTRWYISWAVVGVRRLMDQSKDSRSFRVAIDYIGNPKNAVKSLNNETIGMAEVHQDRRDLIRLCEAIVEVASKCLAHSIIDATNFALSMRQLTDAIHKIESLSIKYLALITGTAVLTRDDGSTIQGKIAGTALPLELVGSAWPVETTLPSLRL